MSKKRFAVTTGPATQKLVNSIAARYRKETKMEWSTVDVLESAASHGLRQMADRLKLDVAPIATLRD